MDKQRLTVDEFNSKYNSYLEDRHYGLAIDIPSVINYLDNEFQKFILLPGFHYSQIKLKFNSCRFYAGVSEGNIDTYAVEIEVNRLVKEHDESNL